MEGSPAGTPFTAMTDAQRLAALTSDNVFWSGALATAANGGVNPKIFAPSPYQPGSSTLHLDEVTFPNVLMTPIYSGPDHTPSMIDLTMLDEMAGTLPARPSPSRARSRWLPSGCSVRH